MPGLTGELLGEAKNDGATYVKPRKLLPATGVPIGVPTGESSGVRSALGAHEQISVLHHVLEWLHHDVVRQSPRKLAALRCIRHRHEAGQAFRLHTGPQLVEVVGAVCASGARAVWRRNLQRSMTKVMQLPTGSRMATTMHLAASTIEQHDV